MCGTGALNVTQVFPRAALVCGSHGAAKFATFVFTRSILACQQRQEFGAVTRMVCNIVVASTGILTLSRDDIALMASGAFV
ncbi:hypothetical protein E2C01_002955 [Portunus trituberculatus]|uniref:Uncharacterized protein n=1 Tax=Portunus trituberculatus TaxID=210409 RepID=A0A5B7CKV9_PORTR|nr:hypothetical protein [Portunus trituberculatus]